MVTNQCSDEASSCTTVGWVLLLVLLAVDKLYKKSDPTRPIEYCISTLCLVAHLYTTPANGLIHSRPRDATIL